MWRSLKYYSIDILNLQLPIRLTDDQAFTLKAALSGHNVFITRQAGTGKSFLLKEIFQQLEQSGKKVAIISSTGISGTPLQKCEKFRPYCPFFLRNRNGRSTVEVIGTKSVVS